MKEVFIEKERSMVLLLTVCGRKNACIPNLYPNTPISCQPRGQLSPPLSPSVRAHRTQGVRKLIFQIGRVGAKGVGRGNILLPPPPPKRHGIRGQKLKIRRARIYLTSRICQFPPYIFLPYQKHRLITFINRSSVTTLPSPRRRIKQCKGFVLF